MLASPGKHTGQDGLPGRQGAFLPAALAIHVEPAGVQPIVKANAARSTPDQVGKHGGLADPGMPGRGEQRQPPPPGQLLQVLEC